MELKPEQHNKLVTKEDFENIATKEDINEFKNKIIGYLKIIKAINNKITKICR